MSVYRNGWCGIARFGGVGDNLMAASPLKLLKEKYGHVEVLSGAPQHVVFENNPYIDKLCITDKQFIPGDTPDHWQGWFRGKAQEFEFFQHLSHTCETLRALFPGQTQFWWPASFRRKFCGVSYIETVHDVCEVPHRFGPLFFPTDAERDKAIETKKKIGERCIVWIISGTRIDKVHPYSAMVIARLIKEIGPVLMLGAPGRDLEIAKQIERDVEKANGSKAGLFLGLTQRGAASDGVVPEWPIRRVLTQAMHGDVVIGPDTGPMWGVAFEQMPKVMLLSHASEENITKHWLNTVTLHADPKRVPCWPCHQLHDVPATCTPNADQTGSACISDISTQTIIDTVGALWSGKTMTPAATPRPNISWPDHVQLTHQEG